MGVVLLYPKPEKGERDKKSAAYISAKRGGFSMDRIDAARKVLDYPASLHLPCVRSRSTRRSKRSRLHALALESEARRSAATSSGERHERSYRPRRIL